MAITFDLVQISFLFLYPMATLEKHFIRIFAMFLGRLILSNLINFKYLNQKAYFITEGKLDNFFTGSFI